MGYEGSREAGCLVGSGCFLLGTGDGNGRGSEGRQGNSRGQRPTHQRTNAQRKAGRETGYGDCGEAPRLTFEGNARRSKFRRYEAITAGNAQRTTHNAQRTNDERASSIPNPQLSIQNSQSKTNRPEPRRTRPGLTSFHTSNFARRTRNCTSSVRRWRRRSPAHRRTHGARC